VGDWQISCVFGVQDGDDRVSQHAIQLVMRKRLDNPAWDPRRGWLGNSPRLSFAFCYGFLLGSRRALCKGAWALPSYFRFATELSKLQTLLQVFLACNIDMPRFLEVFTAV